MVRSEPTAEPSSAAILAPIRLGMAMAAMIRMIATTISNSISEKPLFFRIPASSLRPSRSRRDAVQGKNAGAPQACIAKIAIRDLLLALAEPDLEAHHSVVIAKTDDRNILANVVDTLNDLLGSLVHVGGIGEGQVVPNLLLNGYSGVG